MVFNVLFIGWLLLERVSGLLVGISRLRHDHVVQLLVPHGGRAHFILVGLGSLSYQLALNLFVNLVDVCLSLRKLPLQSRFFLLERVLGVFGVLLDDGLHFRVDARISHAGNHVLAVLEVLGREDVVHSFCRCGLIVVGRLLDELSQRLGAAHGLLKRHHEVLVELLLRILVQLVVFLQ